MSKANKEVIRNAGFPRKGSPKVIPLSPPSLAIARLKEGDGEIFFWRASADPVRLFSCTSQACLSEDRLKTKRPASETSRK